MVCTSSWKNILLIGLPRWLKDKNALCMDTCHHTYQTGYNRFMSVFVSLVTGVWTNPNARGRASHRLICFVVHYRDAHSQQSN